MKVHVRVTKEQALELLNVVPPDPPTYYRFAEKFLEERTSPEEPPVTLAMLKEAEQNAKRTVQSPNAGFVTNWLASALQVKPSAPLPGGRWNLPDTISRVESYPFRSALTSATLRTYVDEWVDTGRFPDGSESPQKRNLFSARDTYHAVYTCLKQNPVPCELVLYPRHVEVSLVQRTWDAVATNFFDAQLVEATRIFLGILISEWRFRLCKCRYGPCGRYFLHPKPRALYRHGTFCTPDHLRRAAALDSVRKSRRRAADALSSEAARKLREWGCASSWANDAKVKGRLATHLCMFIVKKKLHAYRQEVKLNWITRHQDAIERQRTILHRRPLRPAAGLVTLR
jgi:hypothetical protein